MVVRRLIIEKKNSSNKLSESLIWIFLKLIFTVFAENRFCAKNGFLSSLLGQGLLCGFSRISMCPIIAGLPRFTRLNRSTSVMTSSDLYQKYFDPF